MRKTALLTGVAGLFLVTAPAIAQDTAPQTPPAQTPPAASAQAQAPTLTLNPGMTVRGSDGDLGVLVGARTNGGRQQLTVQGADGTVRAVPIDGIHQEGDVVIVDFTLAQFGAAEAVTQPATPATPAEPATPATPGVAPATPATPATPANPAVPAQPDEATPPPTEEATPPAATPPTLPPENPANPAPGEGDGNDKPDPAKPDA